MHELWNFSGLISQDLILEPVFETLSGLSKEKWKICVR